MTALIYSKDYEKHETGNHPENKERTQVIMNSLRENRVLKEIDLFEPEPAREEDLLRVHTAAHLQNIKSFCEGGGGYLDPDTFASPQTYQIAKLSAGGAITASKLVLDGYQNAYSIGRPPGHHATADRAMGFCFFNNLAVSLEYLRAAHKIKKFLIFDFDVHHGNGTSEIFYHDPDVLYISIHQDPRTLFPGTGFITEIGTGEGEGYNLNIPMPPGSTTDDYIYLLENILRPVAHDFRADFHFVDVGFDGHREDPLSGINLDDHFYSWVTAEMMDLAGSLVLILEGGYSLSALSRCNLKMVDVLRGQEPRVEHLPHLQKLTVQDETKNILNQIRDTFSPFFSL